MEINYIVPHINQYKNKVKFLNLAIKACFRCGDLAFSNWLALGISGFHHHPYHAYSLSDGEGWSKMKVDNTLE